MDFIKRIFKSQQAPQPEVVTVRVSKAEKWITLQFKPLLENDFESLRTSHLNCEGLSEEINEQIEALHKVELKNHKLHIIKQFNEHRSLMLQALHRLYSLVSDPICEELLSYEHFFSQLQERLVHIVNVQKKAGHTIAQYAPDEYRKIKGLLQRLVSAQEIADPILRSKQFQQYSHMCAEVEKYKDKIQKKKQLEVQIKKAQTLFDKHKDIYKQNVERHNKIASDKRYEIEKKNIGSSNYKFSFYDYEKEDALAKIDNQKNHLLAIKKHIEELQESIEKLHLRRHLLSLSQSIQSQFKLEVDFIEDVE